MRSCVLASVIACATALPVQADCRLALTLALDVSSSVDAGEYALQLNGVADALQDAEVQAAIFQVPGITIALQVYEWSGVANQQIVADWAEIMSPGDLDALSATLRGHGRSFVNGPTALGQALVFGLGQHRRAPACEARKIDVSGDGQSNVGIPPQVIYQRYDFGDVVVNGLAISSDEFSLARYYEHFVIHGPGAFVEEAADYDAYAEAIKRKLIRELGVPQMGELDADIYPRLIRMAR